MGEEGKEAQQQYRHTIIQASGNPSSRLMDRLSFNILIERLDAKREEEAEKKTSKVLLMRHTIRPGRDYADCFYDGIPITEFGLV